MISIVIPAYNCESYIKKCLDSILKQSFKELEIIVVNNGSTDKTIDILKGYKNRIKLVDLKEANLGKARNIGIKNASGKYILFVDSDDYLEANALKKIRKFITENEADLVNFDYYTIKGERKELTKLYSHDITNIYEDDKLLYEINYGPIKVFRKSIIDKYNITFMEDKKYEDVIFVAKFLLHAKKVGKIEDGLYNYVVHSNSETTVRDKRVFDIIYILKEHYNLYKTHEELMDKCISFYVKTLTNYTVQQRYQKNSKVRNQFIDEAFVFLKQFNWKKCSYLKERIWYKKIIEKSKFLTKLYCLIYAKLWYN